MFKLLHRYDQLNPAAHRFARVPRYGRLLSGLSEDELSSITNEAQLFWTVYTKIEKHPDAATGILHDGLRRPEFENFGWQGSTPAKGWMYSLWQIRLAMDMLGAVAFEIMFGDTPPWNHRDQIRDSVDSDVELFLLNWSQRFRASQAYVSVTGTALREDYVFADWEILVEANRHVLKHFLLSRTEEESLRFNDISTQAFLAAYWAANYVRDDVERERLWSCIPDDWLEERQAYTEFWTFLADMPQAAYHRHKDLPAAKECWEALLCPIFDQSHPHAPMDGERHVIRATKLIYHAWEGMKETAAGQKFGGEFAKILKGNQGSDPQGVAQGLLDGFRFEKPLCQGNHGVNDKGEFTMGCSEQHAIDWDIDRGVRDNPEHKVKLTKFWMSMYCVRNSEYELFEPRRRSRRAFADEVDAVELLDHPVVNVSWYDAACYAKWVGELELPSGEKVRIELPTEAEWEYVCRAGVEGTAFSWDGRLDDNRIESGNCNFDGNYPWSPSQDPWSLTEGGQCLSRTIPVDGSMPDGVVVGQNRWGFSQCHGNVWEWCRDWYDAQTYHMRLEGLVTDPKGPRWATGRVLRGGSWGNFGEYCRAAVRNWSTPANRFRFIGFRLAAVPLSRASM